MAKCVSRSRARPRAVRGPVLARAFARLARILCNQYYDSYANARMKVKIICHILRPKPPDVMLTETLVKFVTATPQEPHKFALILSQALKQLLAMDRYERRALSRRKFAIRAFDEPRRRCDN